MTDSAESDSPISAGSSSGSSGELSRLSVSPVPGPSTSLPDIFTGQGSPSSQIRRSTSEKAGNQPTSNTRSPPRPTPPTPNYSRAFPRPKPPKTSKTTSRPIRANPFNLHNLLPKRSGRDDGVGTDGEQPRKNKEIVLPILDIRPDPPPVSSRPVTPDQKPPVGTVHRSMSSGGRPPSSKPNLTTTGPSANSIFGFNTNLNILPVPVPRPRPHKFGARDHLLTLPQVENTNGRLDIGFTKNGQIEEPRHGRARSLSCPTPEDDRQWRFTPSREFEPFDLNAVGVHAQQARSSRVHNPRNSGVPTDTESTEPARPDLSYLEGPLPPLPSPMDIPQRSRPQAISFSLSSNEASDSVVRLSRSVPDTISGRSPSTTLEATTSGPVKSLSTSSLDIRPRHSTERALPLLQNNNSNSNLGTDNSPIIRHLNPDIPANPRRHKLLEVIYSEMHMARFVNLAPLSLLENCVQTYFKSMCRFLRSPASVPRSLLSYSRCAHACTSDIRLPTSPRL